MSTGSEYIRKVLPVAERVRVTVRPAGAWTAVQPFLWVFKVMPWVLGMGSSLQGHVAGSGHFALGLLCTTPLPAAQDSVGPRLPPLPPATLSAGSHLLLCFCVRRA